MYTRGLRSREVNSWDLLCGTVTKPNQDYGEEKMFTCDCGASFKTDEELFKDPQSEHGR